MESADPTSRPDCPSESRASMAGFAKAMADNRTRRKKAYYRKKGGKRATHEAPDDGKRLINAIGRTGHKKRMSVVTEA